MDPRAGMRADEAVRAMRIGSESRRGKVARVKRGGAVVTLAAVLAIAAAVLVLAWVLGRGPATGATGPASSSPSEPAAAAPKPGPAAFDLPTGDREEAAQVSPARPTTDPARFVGRGRIRGEIVHAGRPLPSPWTLVIEPHPTLVGADRAESRRVVHEPGDLVFDERDLPLGGYRVSAELPGLNSSAESVLLVRGSSDVHVTLRLAPSGLVDGFVFDHRGQPAVGLLVTIEDRRTRARTSTTVDATGMFVVRDVIDGEYQIFFGMAMRPLLPVGDFRFRAPTLRWPEVRLPVTGNLRIAVRDASGAGIAEAVVAGSGTPQGVAAGTVGGDGRLELTWLWPARYRLTAAAPDGRRGHSEVVVDEGRTADVTITVK